MVEVLLLLLMLQWRRLGVRCRGWRRMMERVVLLMGVRVQLRMGGDAVS